MNSVYDPRMGATERGIECKTCGENCEKCVGHPGHIDLNEPIIHPLFYTRVECYLGCVCVKCNRLLLTKEMMQMLGFLRFKGETRFNQIIEHLKKVDICCHQNGTLPRTRP